MRIRRFPLVAATIAALTLIGLTSCVPSTPPTPDPPQATTVLSAYSGPAGSFINVSAPNGQCDLDQSAPAASQYRQLLAGMTIPRTGQVVVQNYQYLWSSISGYTNNAAYVRLRIPPATAVGTYNVFLACQSYLDSYGFAPAKFTVTSSGL